LTLPTDKMRGLVDAGVGWMIYNNPARHNAQSLEMVRAVPTILSAFADDPKVSVVVVTGAGERAFVSGADISEFAERRTTAAARAEYDAEAAKAAAAWAGLDKPIIAMIRGYCLGGGLAIAMMADIRIAAEGSQFAIPAARLGLGYGLAGVETLVSLVGSAWASEILFSARRLGTDEALRIGLVNRVLPGAELETAVRELALAIAGNAPLTLKAAKLAIREARRDPAVRDRDGVRQAVEACFRSADYVEGQRAFLEHRAPDFKGH